MSQLPALRTVAVVVDDGVSAFEMAIPFEVFGISRAAEGLPPFDFFVCSPREGLISATSGLQVVAPHRLGPVLTADLVVVPPCGTEYHPPAELVQALRTAYDRGATIASLCTGAFTLARAGLLEGRRVVTHWFHEAAFRTEFPHLELVPDVLYVEDGRIATSAGTAAGIDLCLHLVRRSHGAAVANEIARRMVVPPHREGGQAQFVRTPVPHCQAQTLAPVLSWATGRLDEDLSVPVLARRAAMSERTFARRFRLETGMTPHQWVQQQRILLAEQLLEDGGMGVEEVARRTGFGSGAMLRHHFARIRRTTPIAYRRTFAGS